MKKLNRMIVILLFIVSMALLTGCAAQTEDPGPPPSDVINSDENGRTSVSDDPAENGNDGSDNGPDILENAVSVRIGRKGKKDWAVNMYNNDASITMLGYLSKSTLLFPTYTYDGKNGYVAQAIRGDYTRNDETEITDVKAGELYLLSGGQLRFYFKDLEDANITATPVGYYTDTEGLTEAVQEAYESNKGDTWGVQVYFQIKKLIK